MWPAWELYLKKRADLHLMETYFSIDDIHDMRDTLAEWDAAAERLRRSEEGGQDEVVGRPRRRAQREAVPPPRRPSGAVW